MPKAWRKPLIDQFHKNDPSTAYQGINRTVRVIQAKFYWPYMRLQIINELLTCNTCNRSKTRTSRVAPSHLPIPTRKFQIVSLDILGERALSKQPQGHLILVVVDRLTGFAQAYPLRSKSWSMTAGFRSSAFLQLS